MGWRPDEVSYVLGHSRSRGIVIESELVPALAEVIGKQEGLNEVIVAPGTDGGTGIRSGEIQGSLAFADLVADDDAEPECFVDDRDPVSYLYTSGTTSFPKGVVGNHTSIYLESLSVAVEARFNESDRFAAMMPMFHTAQLNCHCTAAVAVGAALFIMRGFDAGRLLALIEEEKITQIFGLPMMFRAMLDHPDIDRRDTSSLRRAMYAMATMPEAREIVYRGPHTLTGYLDNTEATDAAFEHGWFHSGDIGHFDADGILWFTDRRKDVIKTGGENVASIEVEKAIYAADENIAEAVVIGLPHERWTEAITAIVVPAPGPRSTRENCCAG